VSRLSVLIDELCPDGVEYRTLASLGRRNRGTAITASKMKVLALTPGPIRVFAGGQTIADVAEDAVPAKDVVRVPSIIVKSRGHIGFIYYTDPFTHKSELWSYTLDHADIDQKFVYYYLLTRVGALQELARATSVKLPQLSVRDTDGLRIPVPPLEVQREIVRILDQFTQLEAELKAELDARARQYGHYRQEALQPGTDARWSTLGAISTRTSSGGTPRAGSAKYYENGTIPWLRTNEVRFGEIWETEVKITGLALGETSAKWIPENCVIIAISGATAGRSAVNKIPLTTNQHCCNLEIDPEQADYRYVFYWVAANYEKLKSLGRGARADLNSALIKAFDIPLPPLPKQREIVALLEKFDALVNDMAIGLPAELAARRRQYEYYRDKLLTFEEAVA